MMRAIVREVPASFANAITAKVPDLPIDVALARVQHAEYCTALEAMGLEITRIAADEACPDCCFVEDTAVVTAGIGLVTRPGAASRRPEIEPIATALGVHLPIARMLEPATLDGGDCMRVGRTIYVGRSARTNAEGIARIAEVFAPLQVVAVELRDVLHLKCVCSPLGGDRMLLARETLPASTFPGADIVWVPASETYAANAVAVGNHVVIADGFPHTRDALAAAGFEIHPVATSEVRKADGSLTCQSIIL
jgi:dimethylargininase